MYKNHFFAISDKNRSILIPVLVGMIGGFAAIGLPMLINVILTHSFWDVVFRYFDYIDKDIAFFQNAAIYILGSFVIGVLSCRQLGQVIRNEKDAIVVGILSGMISYFMIIGTVMVGSFLFSLNSANGYSLREFISIPWLLFFSIGISLIGAWIYYFQKSTTDRFVEAIKYSRPGQWVARNLFIIPAILLIFIIVVPVGIMYMGIRTELFPPPILNYGDVVGENSAIIERPDADTIIITMNMRSQTVDYRYNNPFIDPVPGWDKPRFIILYNSMDMSDQATIDRQGLSVRIDPPDGLHYYNYSLRDWNGGQQSRVILKGPEISNATSKGRVEIFDFNPTRGRTSPSAQVSIENWRNVHDPKKWVI